MKPVLKRRVHASLPPPRLLASVALGGLVLLALAASLGCASAESASAEAQPLFVEVSDPPVAVPADPTIARARVVTVNFDALTSQTATGAGTVGVAPEIALNLFPDVQFTAVRDSADGSLRSPGERLTWIGHLADAPEDRVLLVAGDGTLAASVQSRRGQFEVRYLGEGYHVVVQLNPGQFKPD